MTSAVCNQSFQLSLNRNCFNSYQLHLSTNQKVRPTCVQPACIENNERPSVELVPVTHALSASCSASLLRADVFAHNSCTGSFHAPGFVRRTVHSSDSQSNTTCAHRGDSVPLSSLCSASYLEASENCIASSYTQPHCCAVLCAARRTHVHPEA